MTIMDDGLEKEEFCFLTKEPDLKREHLEWRFNKVILTIQPIRAEYCAAKSP